MTTVWIYVDTNKDVGDADHLEVFASADSAIMVQRAGRLRVGYVTRTA
jgi:hypothetical protein